MDALTRRVDSFFKSVRFGGGFTCKSEIGIGLLDVCPG